MSTLLKKHGFYLRAVYQQMQYKAEIETVQPQSSKPQSLQTLLGDHGTNTQVLGYPLWKSLSQGLKGSRVGALI